ncbi:type II toxin-antitoxin system RelE/ParE family toxin [Moorena producens JHB]|uniref:Type II toxin-antitoxin system RelE/ParE family toxin n=1 Tax=Moorena producens (strain JHB) TaxID=1454205 RepID=A0A1D9GBA9_MOOP1|nr:type II toxin-antitoxin system RelE/ParE family toxin [Moorena producens]AOY84841.2 type II toxin-antitoxin system RelE/ParE family toxin [Moorena producens JHB]
MNNSIEVVFDPRAEEDLDAAAQWYAKQSSEAALGFLKEITTVVERISQYPEAYTVVKSQVRRAPTRRFPFYVYYRFDGDRVTVFAVLHIRRAPDAWQMR